MRTREYPVLSADDREVVDRLALGLGEDAARVLAYLLLRSATTAFGDQPATRLGIRIGTGASRNSVADALSTLEARGLVTETTLQTDRGRPPQAWYPRDGVEATVSRTYRTHALALLNQSIEVAAEFGATDLAAVDGADASTSDDRPTRDLTVGLNWFPNPRHFPLFGATAADRYRSSGVAVTFRRFEGSGAALDGLLDGDADVAVAGAASLVRARSGGAPLVPLAPLVRRAETVLYTTPKRFGGHLTGVEQLRGRTVGMPLDSETGLLGRLFLSQSGVLDDVTVVDVAGEERAALRSGDAEVVTGTRRDVREFEAAGDAIDALPIGDRFPIYGPTLVTTEATVRRRGDALARFLAGTVAGVREAVDSPERVRRALRQHAVTDADADVEEDVDADDPDAWDADDGVVPDHGWGWHETDGWRRLETALRQATLLADSPRRA